MGDVVDRTTGPGGNKLSGEIERVLFNFDLRFRVAILSRAKEASGVRKWST